MSTTIDERVVEMRFDNADFEKNVSSSMGTIEKLKNALNFKDSKGSLENLNDYTKSMNFSGLSDAVQTVSDRFSALGIIGMTALQNITNSAVNAGKQLVKSLTIDQVTSGFQEYEMKMDSIQTIMAGTGEPLDKVKAKLEELNTYADKTIYSFSDMTTNISKFTNAGVGLDEATAAIQGVSNVAALAGSNSEQASHAMLNFSQALSQGYVALIDWKSIKNAQMDTLDFKQSLVETALAMGTVVKVGDKYKTTTTDNNGKVSDAISLQELFNGGLKNQWMTTDVLTETLQQYSTDVRNMSEAEKLAYEEKLKGLGYTEEQISRVEELGSKATDAATQVKTFTQLLDTLKEAVGSGWAMTFEYVIGDFEEAKKLWTVVNDEIGGIIGMQAEARNNLIKGWADKGGRNALIRAFANIWNSIKNIITPIKEALADIFPPATSKTLYDITTRFETLTEKFRNFTENSENMQNLKDAFKGLFSVIDIGKQALGVVVDMFKAIFGYSGDAAGGFLELAGAFGRWLQDLNTSIKELGIFENISQRVVAVVRVLADYISNFIGTAIKSFGEGGGGLSGIFAVIGDKVKSLIVLFGDLFKAITGKDISNVIDRIASAIDWLKDAFVNLFSSFSGSSILEWLSEKLGILKNGLDETAEGAKSFADIFNNAFSSLKESTGIQSLIELLGGIAKAVLGLAKSLGGVVLKAIDAFVDRMANVNFDTLLGIINTIVLGNLGIKIKNIFDPLNDVGDLIDNLKADFAALRGTLEAFTQNIKAGSLIKIGAAMMLLALSMSTIASIDSDKLATSLGSVTVLMGELVASLKILSTNSKLLTNLSIASAAKSLVSLSIGVLLLAGAMKVIADIDIDKMDAALASVMILVAELTASLKVLSVGKTHSMTKGATGLIAMAAAILVLSKAAEVFAKMEWEELGKAGAAISTLILALGLFAKLPGKPKHMISTGLGMIAIAEAMIVFADAAGEFAKLNWEELAKAGAAIGGIILALGLFTKLPGSPKHMISIGLGMVAIGESMKLFATAAESFSKLDWEELGKAGAAFGGLLLGMSLFANFTGGFKMITNATGMLIMAGAINAFVPALKGLSSLEWEQLGKAGAGLGGLLLALSLFSNFTGGLNLILVSTGMVVLAGALALLVPEILILGKVQTGTLIQGLLGLAAGFALIGGAAALLTPVIPGILGLGAAIAVAGVGIAAFGAGVLAIAAALGTLSTISVVAAGEIVASLNIIIVGFLQMIPNICEAIGLGIITIVETIANSADAVLGSIVQIIESLVTAILQAAPVVVDGILQLIQLVLQKIGENIQSITESLVNIIIGVIKGLAARIPDFLGAIGEFIGSLMSGIAEMINATISAAGSVFSTIGETLGNIIGSVVGGVVEGMRNAIDMEAFGEELSDFMTALTPFIDSAKGIDGQSMQGISALADAILTLTGADILDGLAGWISGDSSMVKFGKELCDFAPYFKEFSRQISGIDNSTIVASSNAAKTLAEFAEAIPNEGGLVAKFTGENSLTKFGEELASFGPHFKEYATSISGINTSAVTASAGAAKAIAEFAEAIPNEGGLVAKFTGENSLAVFGEELAKFGPHFKEYATAITGIDTSAVTASANAAKSIADFADAIPNSGGLVAKITGDNSISKFGEELANFAPNFQKYYEYMKSVQPDVVNKSSDAINSIIALSQEIPNSGGLVSLFTGDNEMAEFGIGIVEFANSFSNYAAIMEGVNTDVVDKSSAAAKTVVDLNNQLGNNSWFDLDIDSFGSMLSSFADYFVYYASQMGTIGLDNIASMSSRLQTTIDTCMGVSAVSTDAMMEFGGALGEMATGIYSAVQQLGQVDAETISTAMTGIITALANGVTNNTETVAERFRQMLTSAIAVFGGYYENFRSEGSNLISRVILGMGSQAANLSSKCRTLLAGCATSLRNYYNEFHNVGVYLSEGLANGIVDGRYKVVNAAKEVAKAAKESSMKELDEHSPSKEYYKIGEFTDEGFANGITENGDMVVDAAEDVAKKVLSVTDEQVNEYADRMDYGQDVFKEFVKTYGTALEEMGDTDVLNTAAIAIENLGKKTQEVAEDGKKSTKSIKDSFNEMVKGIKSSIEGSLNIFEEWDSKTELTGDKLLANMRSQIQGISSWATNMQSLAAKGIDDGLYKELAEMGPKGAEYVNAFAQMTASQMAEANTLYAQSLTLPDTLAQQVASGMAYAGLMYDQGLVNGIKDNMSAVYDIANQTGQNAIQGGMDGMGEHSPSVLMYQAGAYYIEGLRLGIANNEGTVKNACRILGAQLVLIMRAELSSGKMGDIGRQMMAGLESGINSGSSGVINAAIRVAEEAASAIRSKLEIHSPSRVLAEIGKFMDLGWAKGIDQYASEVVGSSEAVANRAMTAINDAINKASEELNANMNADPVIRPVVDLSDVEAGAKQINAMMSYSNALNASSAIASAGSSFKSNASGDINTTDPTNSGMTFIQNNYSPTALNRIDIYRQTKNQFATMKGLVRG